MSFTRIPFSKNRILAPSFFMVLANIKYFTMNIKQEKYLITHINKTHYEKLPNTGHIQK